MARKSKPSKSERRKSKRETVLDTFNIFVAFPSMGHRKFELKDISKGGFAVRSENPASFGQGQNKAIAAEFYLNSSLHLPIKVRIAHDSGTLVGFEVVKSNIKANIKERAVYKSLVDLIVSLSEYI